MHSILEEIVAAKRTEVAERKRKTPLEQLKSRIKSTVPERDFYGALSLPGRVTIIAEIKRASPSRGIICREFDPVRTAKEYTAAGAAAISILTEVKYFQGDLEYLQAVRAVTNLPLLRKDFIIDPYQVYEAKVYGADAILLIAALLSADEIKEFSRIASSLGLECLAEVHSQEEMDKALASSCRLIGINNRNLNDFSLDLNISRTLYTKVPHGKTVVIESGIKNGKDIAGFMKLGIHAFLIGETLMQSPDIGKTMKELTGASQS